MDTCIIGIVILLIIILLNFFLIYQPLSKLENDVNNRFDTVDNKANQAIDYVNALIDGIIEL